MSCRNKLWKKNKPGEVKVFRPTSAGKLSLKNVIKPSEFWKPKNKRQRKVKPISEGRQSIRYNKWRAAVLSRDSYKCVICESTKRIEAHHIIRWADNEAVRFDQKNGVSLCYDCHQKYHNYNKEPFPLHVTKTLMKYIDYRYDRARLKKVPRKTETDYNAVQAVNSRTNKNVPR